MPTYQYRCRDCGETFDQVERMSEHHADGHRCPRCGGENVAQLLSPFVAKTAKKS